MIAHNTHKVGHVCLPRQVMRAGSMSLVCRAAKARQTSITHTDRVSALQDQVSGLEHELAAAVIERQVAAGDLTQSSDGRRTTGGEAWSANEELQSASEELLAAKDELQVLAEEMASLDARLQDALHQQRMTFDDLQNVIRSHNAATIFLDTKLAIRFFTPAARSLLNVIPSDIGRPFSDLASFSTDGSLAVDAQLVLESSAPVGREVQAKAEGWFMRRIVPYLANDKGVDGLVITFTNITQRDTAGAPKAAQQDAELTNAAKNTLGAFLKEYNQMDAGMRERSRGVKSSLAIQQQIGDLLGRRVSVQPHCGESPVFEFEMAPTDQPMQLPGGHPPETADVRHTPTVSNGATELERVAHGTSRPDVTVAPRPARHAASVPVVFIVEDDHSIRTALCEVLEAEGLCVQDFETCEAFLDAYRPGYCGCLLIDAYLPGMNGLELLRRMHDAGSLLPAIMITGRSDVAIAVQAMKAGALDFIEKPVGHGNLLASVAHALKRSRDANEHSALREDAATRMAGLTERQRQVMDLVLAGQPSKIIAADLGVSQRTVENHRAVVMRKTGARSLPALARMAAVLARNSANAAAPGATKPEVNTPVPRLRVTELSGAGTLVDRPNGR